MSKTNDDIKLKCKLFNGWWKKNDCKLNPNCLFVFGDNVSKKGCGGQALIRYMDNSIGISTEYGPSRDRKSYFSDEYYDEAVGHIKEDIDNILDIVDDFDTIYFPLQQYHIPHYH